jgi:uncharacterized protein YbjQ (UPF0145 family)
MTPITRSFQASMVSTNQTIEGYRITHSYGVVRGLVVRSRSIIGSFGASLQTIFGGNISILTELCERTRADSLQRMMEHAAAIGANAVVGMRYDATEVMSGVSEVLCYGTAVTIEPIQ